jgi:hypothetical protein
VGEDDRDGVLGWWAYLDCVEAHRLHPQEPITPVCWMDPLIVYAAWISLLEDVLWNDISYNILSNTPDHKWNFLNQDMVKRGSAD